MLYCKLHSTFVLTRNLFSLIFTNLLAYKFKYLADVYQIEAQAEVADFTC